MKNQIKMVFFDMDGVLFDVAGYTENGKKVAISTWNAVFDALGIYHEHERLKEMFIKGDFPSYIEWTDEACRVLQKNRLTKEKFMKIINERPLMKGAIETLNELKKRSYKTAVITGSFEALALRAKKLLGLDYAIGHCRLNFDKDGNLKSWELIPCDFDGKIDYFKKIAKRAKVKFQECAFVGDEVNDIPIFKKVGLSIAFNSTKKEVKEVADIVIDKKDLREILAYFPSIKNVRSNKTL
jgi:phosphoserine phosphatase